MTAEAGIRKVDIAIVGGGLAGSAAAVMLGRTDYRIALIDPYASPRPDFRCEKLDPSQARLLHLMGLAGLVLPCTTHNRELWVARFGRVIDRMQIDQYGILYHDLVSAVRAGIPKRVERVCGTVAAIETSAERQIVRVRDGETVDARLIVLANGLNRALQQSLGITYATLSPFHSTTIGFDVVSHDKAGLAFDSLTYYGENPNDRTAYLTLFKLGETVRANLMTYREAKDPWLQAFRDSPKSTLLDLAPNVAPLLGDFSVAGPIRIRPADLYIAEDAIRPGVVLIGDAFSTSCPAAGTGTNKVLRDVQRLCSVHVPSWMPTSGMDVDKIKSFYADPEKRDEDLASERAAFRLKSTTLEPGIVGYARRRGRFFGRWLKGWMRRASEGLAHGASSQRDKRPSESSGAVGGQAASSLRAEIHVDITPLTKSWIELEQRCTDVTIFQTADWCRAWIEAAQAVGEPASVRLATVWRGERLVLLWPLALRRFSSCRIVHALAEPATQYADLLIDPEEDRAALLEFVWASILRWPGIDAVELRRVRDESALSLLPGLTRYAVGPSRASAPLLDFRCLDADSADAQRTSRTRNALRRHKRSLARTGPVVFEFSNDQQDQFKLLSEAFALKREWQRQKSFPSSGYAHRASEGCLLRLAEEGHLRVARLRVGSETAAIEIGAFRGRRYWSLVQTYKLRFAKHSPGRLLFWHLLALCPDLSIEVFDFLAPAHAHKLEWSNREIGICDYVIPISLKGRALTFYLSRIKPRLRDAYLRLPPVLRSMSARLILRLS